MKYRKLIDNIVIEKAESVCNGIAVKNGHNGPYYDVETNLRNISHWACTFEKYYFLTKDKLYLDALEILAKSLEEIDSSKPCVCRMKYGKDKTNGVIGQAWVIEGLLACARGLNNDNYYEMALSLFNNQRFDEKYGMWSVIECDGKDLGFDLTFNHQLWFAAIGSELLNYKYDSSIDARINQFLVKADKFFIVHNNGLIFHFLKYIHDFKSFRWYRRAWKSTEKGLKKDGPSLVYKEKGYHLFSVYALAIMQERYGNTKFFQKEDVKKAIAYAFDEKHLRELSNCNSDLDSTHISKKSDKRINAYSYPYNSPAFEFPYIAKVFGPKENYEELVDYLLEEQIRWTYDESKKRFCRNTEDSETLNARIYELVKAF